jgi:hypothetical protein
MKMHKNIWFVLFAVMFAGTAGAQWMGYTLPQGSEIDAGMGLTWIDNQSYYVISFQPDISIGKFGIGLGINLLYNPDTGKLRGEDWDEAYDVARLIRYLRWGRKGDPLYARVGALDNTRIGHGFLLNFYNNQIFYDERKLGLLVDADLGYGGVETMTSNLGRLELLGGRGYIRPLHGTQIPVLKNAAIGATYITDTDPDQWRDSKDAVSAYGVDIEFPLVKTEIFKTLLYADHAKIQDWGSGQMVGFGTEFDLLGGWLRLGFNLERRFLGKHFISNYYGPFYEVLRYSTVGELWEFYESLGGEPNEILLQTLKGYFADLGYDVSLFPEDVEDLLPYIEDWQVTKEMLLPMMSESRKGWYFGLGAEVFHLVNLFGSYQVIDEQENSGMLHLGAMLSQSVPFIALEATYDKRGIGNFKDVRTLDYRSVARVGIGYKVTPYILLYLDYIWSYQWDEEGQMYKPQERFSPRVAFRYAF